MSKENQKRSRLEIESFLKIDEANFRDLEGRFVILPNGLERFRKELAKYSLLIPEHFLDVLGMVYIDYDLGLTLYIFGAISPEYNDAFLFEEMHFPVELRLRFGNLAHNSVMLLENFWEPESSRIARRVMEQHYDNPVKNKVRELVWLDAIRHPLYPDGLEAMTLHEDGTPNEKIWVRPVGILSMEERSIGLEVEILSTPPSKIIEQGKFSVVIASAFDDGTPLAVLQTNIQKDAAGAFTLLTIDEVQGRTPFDKAVAMIKQYIGKEEWVQAEELLLELARGFDEQFPEIESDERIVKQFYTRFEEAVFHELVLSGIPVAVLRHDFAWVFNALGRVYQQLGKNKQAVEMMNKACLLAPIHSKYQLDLAHAYQLKNDWDDYLICTRNALDFACSKKMIGASYRAFATFFEAKEEYEHAAEMLYLSLEFDALHKDILPQLERIFKKFHQSIKVPDEMKLTRLLEAYDIPFGANPQIMELAFVLATQMEGSMDKERKAFAKELYTLLYDVTDDEEFSKKLHQMKFLQEKEGL